MSDNQNNPISYAIRSLRGAGKLAMFKAEGLDDLDISSEGFWKSFWVILIALPLFMYWMTIKNRISEINGYTVITTAYMLFYIMILPLFALVMAYFTRFLKVEKHYATMIIAYNWQYVIGMAISTALMLLFAIGLLGNNTVFLLQFMAGIYIHIYTWFLLKITLQISGLLAFGIFIFQVLIHELLQAILITSFHPDFFETLGKSAALASDILIG